MALIVFACRDEGGFVGIVETDVNLGDLIDGGAKVG
jgi:hypothetical protein